jgi:hypothetical protein
MPQGLADTQKPPERLSPNMTAGAMQERYAARPRAEELHTGVHATIAELLSELFPRHVHLITRSDVRVLAAIHALRNGHHATQQASPSVPHQQRGGAALPAEQVRRRGMVFGG